jgi:aspartyl-tRNA(Asn)/glutamyl-tRNA(Gln) amidotransferase subunit A
MAPAYDGGRVSEALCDLTAIELANQYRAGEASPIDMIEAVLARTARLNPVLNAIVTLDAAGARAAAEQSAARWRRGEPRSALDGVPMTVKDNLIAAGLRSTWGSRVCAGYVPDHDELPVARLRAAGLVIVGKTNVPEFTLQGYTDNLLFGPTCNPWNPQLTPGGSSGGAVASVAARIVPIAIGTDGGGSIRRPASHTGLVGLKPTVGRIARADGFPVILHDFEVVGPMARDTADVSAFMAMAAGPDPRDPASLAWPAWSEVRNPAEGRRILYVPAFANGPVDPEIVLSVKQAAGAFADLGHEVVVGEAPFDADEVAHAFGIVASSGLAWLMRDKEHKIDLLSQGMHTMLEAGNKVRAMDYVNALATTTRLKKRLADFFSEFDVLMTPAAAALPWPTHESHPSTIACQPVGPRGHAVFTAFANVAGSPALALPCMPSSTGLPIGLQLVGPHGGDEMLLALGRTYEGKCPWRDRYPKLLEL